MELIQVLFWLGIAVIFYAYFGYGLLIYFLVRLKRMVVGTTAMQEAYEPDVTFIIPCYNEADILEQKVKNTLALNYPKDKLQIMFVTDGSTDGSEQVLQKYARIKVLHDDRRAGKSAAVNRAMKYVETSVVVLSDANTILPPDALGHLTKHYADPNIGAVSGEKRVLSSDVDSAAGAGEGLYWKYESLLKKLDAEFYTLVGAAGELVSFRTDLYTELEEDTILDDFILSLRVVEQGYKVAYEPMAYAMETASANVKEEFKRKVRICAGGWQAMARLKSLLNPFKDFRLSFEYISHRVLRWSLAPFFLLMLIPLSVYLHWAEGGVYSWILLAQMMFYLLAVVGWYLENRQIRYKVLFVPFYFTMMNYAVFAGFLRFIKGKQNAAWERSKRANSLPSMSGESGS
ncbi:MAG TPA: glycosyltransferase family 2 protein [Cytophagaceae bacterium]